MPLSIPLVPEHPQDSSPLATNTSQREQAVHWKDPTHTPTQLQQTGPQVYGSTRPALQTGQPFSTARLPPPPQRILFPVPVSDSEPQASSAP